ncbi:MAG: hypothetical protein ACK5MK_04545 [Dysgonomonas sp.]
MSKINTIFKILCVALITFGTTQSLYANIKDRELCDSLIQKGIEESKRSNYSQSLELLSKANILAESGNWDKLQLQALNGIGSTYFRMLDFGESIKYFLAAYELAHKNGELKDEMGILNNIGALYYQEKIYDKAKEYTLKGYKLAQEQGDEDQMGMYAINLANIANKTNDLKQSSNYLEIAHKMLKGDKQHILYVFITEIELLYLKGNYSEAENLAKKILPDLNDVVYVEDRASILVLLSKIYEHRKDFPKTLDYLQEALNIKPNLKSKIDIYQDISDVYKRTNDLPQALLYKDSVLLAKDSLNILTNIKQYENSKLKFEIENYQKALIDSHEKLYNQRKTFIFIGISVILAIIVVILVLRQKNIKNKQAKLFAEQNQKITSLQLEQEKSNKLLLENQLKKQEALATIEQMRLQHEQQQLKNEIEAKNRELTTKAIYISDRKGLINEVLEALLELRKANNDPQLGAIIQKLKLKHGNDKSNFLDYFEEVNIDFLAALKLKHPNLTSNDIRFLSYIYMNLNTKEISSLLNITMDSCQKKKKRICQKINLPNSAMLYSYITSL